MKVTGVPAQMVPFGLAAILTFELISGFIFAISEFEVAGLLVAQDSDDVMTQLITSLSARVAVENAELLLPNAMPLMYHW